MFRHGDLDRPGACIHSGIRHGSAVDDGIRIASGEALDDSEIFIAHAVEISDAEAALIVDLEVR